MNSALQCIAHCEPLTEYFQNKLYKVELNKTNPLGTRGRLPESYARLLASLFSEDGKQSITPGEFKRTLGEFAPNFSGYKQQDSLEFLEFLMAGIHEDLNRIREKPYKERDLAVSDEPSQEQMEQWGREAWEDHKARNDSIVVDLFHGMFKSTTVCGKCRGVAVTFDPFQDVTVPLPLHKMYHSCLRLEN